MNITAGIAAIVVLAGAAVGLAGPAQADSFSGTFTPNGPGLDSTWVVTPCGPDCARISDSSGWLFDRRDHRFSTVLARSLEDCRS